MAGGRADPQVSIHPCPRPVGIPLSPGRAQFPSHSSWCPPHTAEGRAQQFRDRTHSSWCRCPCSVAWGAHLPLLWFPLHKRSRGSPRWPASPSLRPQVKNLSSSGSPALAGWELMDEAPVRGLSGLPPAPGPTHLPSPGPAPDPRGEELSAIQKGAVVVVANEVPGLGRLIAGLWGRGQNLDFHRISRVVEVNDMDVEDQHSGARDLVSWGQNREWIGLESSRGCSGLHRGP